MYTATSVIATFWLLMLVCLCIKSNNFTWFMFGLACGLLMALCVAWSLVWMFTGGR